MIDDEREARAIEQRDHPRRVGRVQGIGQPNVGNACVGEYFRLAELCATNTDGAALDLPACDARALVRLRVGPQANTFGRRGRLHAVNVREQPCPVNQDSGGWQHVCRRSLHEKGLRLKS
jgi:hypothetical protein